VNRRRERDPAPTALIARGRILGAITLVDAESGRRYDAADLTLVEDLAARAALAVENARLYREARDAVRKRDDFLSVASHCGSSRRRWCSASPTRPRGWAAVPALADRQGLDQVLTNLVANALKSGDRTPVEVQVDCNSGPTVRVTDRGPGIPPEEQGRIFERGRLAETRSGMGLGLWIVREIVLAHQGRVWVEAPPGGGAAFGVSLPSRG